MCLDGVNQLSNNNIYSSTPQLLKLNISGTQIEVNKEAATKKCKWFLSLSARWETNDTRSIDFILSPSVFPLLKDFLNEPSLDNALNELFASHPTHKELWELTGILDYFLVKTACLEKLYNVLEQHDPEVVLSLNNRRTALTLGTEGAKVLLQACQNGNIQTSSSDLRMDKIQFWLEHDMKEIHIKKILEQDQSNLGNEILELLPEMKQLTSLSFELARVEGGRLTDVIAQLPELQTLHIQKAFQVKKEHVEKLYALEKLTNLSLEGCLGLDGLPTPTFPLALTSLSIANSTRINSDEIVSLCLMCPHLKVLNITYCTQIKPQALARIKACHPYLEVISKGCIQLQDAIPLSLTANTPFLSRYFHHSPCKG